MTTKKISNSVATEDAKDNGAWPGAEYELCYNAAEAAHISKAVASGVDIEWCHGACNAPIMPMTSDDALRHARLGHQVGLVPKASGLVVMELTLDDAGSDEAWRRHWTGLCDRHADHQHCMLFGPTLRVMQCWWRPVGEKTISDCVATEDAHKKDGLRFQSARLDIYAARPVVVWHPSPSWVELITKAMAPVERRVFQCKRGGD